MAARLRAIPFDAGGTPIPIDRSYLLARPAEPCVVCDDAMRAAAVPSA